MWTAVYAITDGKDYKIGISDNPERRLKDLQTGNPRKLVLDKFEWFPTEEGARRAEADMHQVLRAGGCGLEGEWFSDAAEMSIQMAFKMCKGNAVEYSEKRAFQLTFLP